MVPVRDHPLTLGEETSRYFDKKIDKKKYHSIFEAKIFTA